MYYGVYRKFHLFKEFPYVTQQSRVIDKAQLLVIIMETVLLQDFTA